jgi:uncharacterized membrane protein YcjF (UPF0283 family)
VIRKQGKFRQGVVIVASMAPSIVDLVRGLWRSPDRKRWLVPVVVFLCVTAVLLILATTVEGLAPFIYSIF